MQTERTLSTPRFLPLFFLAMLVNIFAQAAHETGHHLVYQVMGHEPEWGFTRLVQMSDTTPSNPGEWTPKTYPNGATNWLKVSSLPSGKAEEVAAAPGPLAALAFVTFAVLGRARQLKNG